MIPYIEDYGRCPRRSLWNYGLGLESSVNLALQTSTTTWAEDLGFGLNLHGQDVLGDIRNAISLSVIALHRRYLLFFVQNF